MKSLRRLLVTCAIGFAVLPNSASACSVQTAEAQAREDAALAQYLHRYADIIVFGQWIETRGAVEEIVEGFVHVEGKSGERRIPVAWAFAIDCQRRPSNDAVGTFYLRADIDDPADFSPAGTDLLRSGIEYTLIHFEPLLIEYEGEQ